MSDRRTAVDSPPPSGRPPLRPSREEIARAVRDFQAGEHRRANFQLLHRFYHPRVERFLARRVYSPEERLDLNQEVFLRIYRNLEGFRGEGSLDGWVIRITQNVYRRWRDYQPGGKSAAPETLPLDSRPSNAQIAVMERSPLAAEPPSSPLEETLGRERAETIRSAIEELPPRMRRALQLAVYQERSVNEIAELLRIAPGTVKAHLFKAREELRKKLQEQFGGFDSPTHEAQT